jgi:hypothetical protein
VLEWNLTGNMSSIRQTSKIAILAVIAITLTVALTAHSQSQSFSLYSTPKTIFTNTPLALNNSGVAINPVLPVIAMTNVPLSQGIHGLLQRSRMQATIDRHLTDWWAMTNINGHHINEPMLNFRLTNMTASDALAHLLREYHLTMEVEPVSLDTQITYDHGFSGYKDIDHSDFITNKIPLIQFEDVPISIGLYNLALTAGINYTLDPDLLGYWYSPGVREPLLTLKWTNVTAEQVFRDICADYGLVISRDPLTGVILVRRRGHDVDIVNPDVYANDTNVIPLIEFKDVRLSIALENLARQAGIKCILSPRIDTGHVDTEPSVNIRWQTSPPPRPLPPSAKAMTWTSPNIPCPASSASNPGINAG